MPNPMNFMCLLLVAWAAACTDADPTRPTMDIQGHHAEDNAFNLAAPMFGLDATSDGSIMAAVASAGVMRIRGGRAELIASLPGVNDVADARPGTAFAATGGSTDPSQILPTSRKLFKVTPGAVQERADLWAFEQANNPDGFWHKGPTAIESNPFDVEVMKGENVLVADAAANDVLIVNEHGQIDVVAVLTPVVLDGPEPVPTSLAVGPEGALFVGELTGFPGTPGLSRIWRVLPATRNAVCPGPRCTVFATGFTSIIDLAYDGRDALYVVELDEASWFALELNGFQKAAGGTVTRCNVHNGLCRVVAENLSLPTAITVDREKRVWVTEHHPSLFAAARVRRLGW